MNFLSELSFRVSFTKRQCARSLHLRSNPNSIIGLPSPTPSVHGLVLNNLSLTFDKHINNSVSVRILRNLHVLGLALPDVFGLLVNLLRRDGFRFSARSA